MPEDFDGDTLPDNWETDPKSSTSPISPDTDGDGFADDRDDDDSQRIINGLPTMGNPGDGFSCFDEYRGFRVGGVTHERYDTHIPDLFIFDGVVFVDPAYSLAIGIDYHQLRSGILTHVLKSEEEWGSGGKSTNPAGGPVGSPYPANCKSYTVNYNGDDNVFGVGIYTVPYQTFGFRNPGKASALPPLPRVVGIDETTMSYWDADPPYPAGSYKLAPGGKDVLIEPTTKILVENKKISGDL